MLIAPKSVAVRFAFFSHQSSTGLLNLVVWIRVDVCSLTFGTKGDIDKRSIWSSEREEGTEYKKC